MLMRQEKLWLHLSLVTGYFPLYIDEGELTFDKTGKIINPKETVHYEKLKGFSISLDMDLVNQHSLLSRFCFNSGTGRIYLVD